MKGSHAFKKLMKIGRTAVYAVATVLLPQNSIAEPLQADEKAIHSSLVRIVANGSTSSGFLYGSDNRSIIASLHSVLPPRGDIEIFCRRNPATAVVVKYLKEADLVLLQATEDLEELGCKAMSGLKIEALPPNTGEELYAFGYKPGNSRSAFSKKLTKASGNPETLEALVPDKALSVMQQIGMPDVRQRLYYVNGGIYPGYSGGPVFNDQGLLVGIVQGGLDKGSSNHDWLVPASAIATLLNSPSDSRLPDINPSDYGYSSPPAEQSSSNFITSGYSLQELKDALDGVNVLDDYANPIDECLSDDYEHTWVLTRTRSFANLYDTSDPAEGLDQLLEAIFPSIETSARKNQEFDIYNLQFNIYEELCRGMVIAVPVGTQLAYEDTNDGLFLVTTNDQALFKVGHEPFSFELDDGTLIGPEHEDFTINAVDYYQNECNKSFAECDFVPDFFREVRYSDGSGIIRTAFQGENAEASVLYYYSVVFSRGEVLEVTTHIDTGEGSALDRCFGDETPESCEEAYWRPMSFMLANLLTNIIGKPVDEEPSILTGNDLLLEEEQSSDAYSDQGTEQLPANYSESAAWTIELVYENGASAFQRDAQGNWWVGMDGQWVPTTLYSADLESENPSVVLLHESNYWHVPLNGGIYSVSVSGGDWMKQYPVWPR